MKTSFLAVGMLLAIGLNVPHLAAAQAIKLHKKTTAQGEIDRTPYVTYTAFEATAVGGKRLAGKSSGEEVTLGNLVAVSSLDEVIRLLGEPDKLNRGAPFGDVRAYLHYKGMLLDYIKYDKDDPDLKFELRDLEITSSDWSFTINGTRLRPGMSVHQLSPAVRQTLDEDFDQSVDAFGAVVIAKPGTAKQAKRGGELEAMRGGATIQIEVNGGIVDEVRFTRVY